MANLPIFASMHIVRYVLALSLLACAAHAQTELGDERGSSRTWSLLSLQRTWTPQLNDAPNWGFGFSGFNATKTKDLYLGLTLLASGVGRRDVLALTFGPGYWLAGDRRAGLFTWLQGGVAMSSRSGATGFNPFSDNTLEWGFGLTSGVGGTVRITDWLQLQAAIVANAYSTDGGRTPYGFQVGFSGGGP
ncbi:MAG: hypothetical protein FGM24_09330 [Candidatus Kapabacteria bacterium]|nr:hypothetical protein [Candidatus Kapabacteria bacterium]